LSDSITIDDRKAVIAQVSHWQAGGTGWDARELPLIRAEDVQPICSDLDLWDCWPLQHEDGTTATIGGAQYWFFLSAPRLPDPGQRHVHARIRLLRRAGGEWHDCGPALPADLSPGHAEWAGSCVLHDDGRSVTLFFTAAGRRGGGPSFEQRIFAIRGGLSDAGMPGYWHSPEELFTADGALFQPANSAHGAPGTIKAFRDPAWFRDPADGACYLLFTGSAGWSDDPHNGLVGYARWTGERWELGRPLLHAVGTNNELERAHVIHRGGRYYLFWSTQRHTFSPDVEAGPNGLYGAVADSLMGPWRMANGSGLIACNPLAEPTQAYSWWVTGEGEVWSFVDYWGMQGRSLADRRDLLRSQFGGTPAPRFALEFDGDRVTPAA
jgi:levansucrase